VNILITGNLGYIGGSVMQQLRNSYPDAVLIGYDTKFFPAVVADSEYLIDNLLDEQYQGDIRKFPAEILNNIDVIVHLAAISNDPMGSAFEQLTLQINHEATIRLAEKAKKAGVKKFIFASSCSVYGNTDESLRSETSSVAPLTVYAKSKVLAEDGLAALADKNFTVITLRFPTACGMSDCLRLDLVLNDFVAAAVTTQKISILSNGTPWRPLIDVKDMARGIHWAVAFDQADSPVYQIINVGSNNANFQIKELADAVANLLPAIEISVNENAPVDLRSYRVDFSLYQSLAAAEYQPQCQISDTITQLHEGLEKMSFKDRDFRQSGLIRLNHLNYLRQSNLLDADLYWKRA
jgi:nucleoside-diphosphate-sugar epimerase